MFVFASVQNNMRRPEHMLLWNFMMAALVTLSQARPNLKHNFQPDSGLRSECAGNLMRLSFDKALAVGNHLEVEAINGTQLVTVTPSLAAQCGYSMESDPWGNTRIYTSLMGCYVDNKDDSTFNVALRIVMLRNQSPSSVASYDVTKTCSYTRWAPREILCDRNYMEVSQQMAPPAEAKGQAKDVKDETQINTVPGVSDGVHGVWKMTFFTPDPVPMVLKEATDAGYAAMTTTNRLVMRSPYNTAETYSEEVAGVPMEVFKVSAYYKAPHGLSVMNLAAACPVGGLLFTEETISWYVPRRVTPLVDGNIKILEMFMGIDGQRLDNSQMAARGYTLSTSGFHIVIEIPVGSPGGYYKSHAPDYQYHITFSVEPMLEVLWRDENTHDDTRYKVLFPITTPMMPRAPHVKDATVPQDRMFTVHLGTFLHDVELRNITFSTGVLTVEQTTARGFSLQEYSFSNGSKSFSLQVPFDADVVLKHNPEPLVTAYFLPLVFGFLILPEETPFALPVHLEAALQDVVLPTIAGSCDKNAFYISVKYGNQGPSGFQTLVGSEELTPEVADTYNYAENNTHFNLVVPFIAKVTAFELLASDSIRARLDVLLWDAQNKWVLADLYLACSFPFMTTECHPNGTMTALAVKVESVPNLDPGLLTLKDRSCKPVFSNNRFARFSFELDSCGTTRTFFGNYVLYENEIGLHYNIKGATYTSPVDPDYKQTISCYYVVNDTQTVSFHTEPINQQPAAEVGSGQLMVQMRLAEDSLYKFFYKAEDYPVAKYLQQPLYFGVELMHCADPQLELILENCWATLHEDRTSLPSWDIIVEGCENHDDSSAIIFQPVATDTGVAFAAHNKRFSVQMLTFTKDEEVLKNKIYVHCDAVICDTNSAPDDACRGQCANPSGNRQQGVKRGRRSTKSSNQRQLSSGQILLTTQSNL